MTKRARTSSRETSAAPTPHFPVVGIGASAGGLEAFSTLLKMLPSDTGMAFVLIQHLDPTHPSFLCEALAKTTQMPVIEAGDGLMVTPDHVYVIPPNSELAILGGRLSILPRPADSKRPHLPVDFFLRSLAAERGARAIGVVLSGTASDGTDGLRAIQAEGGITLVQDPRTAKFAGMPKSALDAGVVDYSLGLSELTAELVRLSGHSYVGGGELPAATRVAATLDKIFAVVRNQVGIDLSEYKPASIERRLARRMALRKVDSTMQYLVVLQSEPTEVQALYEDVLIHVTSFFRDPEVFETLTQSVFPAILKTKAAGAPIRIWVAGCSTGQEVYSLAIALLEHLEEPHPIQIFGSDVSEKAIEAARAGAYTDGDLRGVSDERRRRFFTKTTRGYQIAKAVRDLCVFVQHDLARDPPFSKLDLVTCRNVLIYFDAALQKRVLPTLHYALAQPGFLLLGRTETISGFDHLFRSVEPTANVFARSATTSSLHFRPQHETPTATRTPASPSLAEASRRSLDLGKHLDRMLMERYAPPSVLVSDKMDVLQYRGAIGSYLQPPPGEPQHNLFKMARGGLLATLRASIARARKEMAPVRVEDVEVDQDASTRLCTVVVLPLAGLLHDPRELLFVVLFESVAPPPPRRKGAKAGKAGDQRQLPRLAHELAATKDYLQSLIEEHGRATADLGAANEELVSGNEELQSLNEELETAKEELQSTNEELTTVNDELNARNREVTVVNSDLVNLLAAVELPILILDRQRRIRRFTPKSRTILNVLASDVGRPLEDIKINLDLSDLDEQISAVIDNMEVRESEVQDRSGRWYRMQIRPYKTTENVIDGAILSLVDITLLKHHVAVALEARVQAEKADRAKDQFLATLSHELRNPLSTMLLQAQLLLRGNMDVAQLQRAGESIERGTKIQVQLIDDLLDVSRIVAGKLRIDTRPLPLSSVISSALDGVTMAAQRKSIEIEVDLGDGVGDVMADPLRMHQVVANLLSNAIKFTPQKGHVRVSLSAAAGVARIEVSDDGAGIDAEFLPYVFNRFSQADDSDEGHHGGLGLGLAIVQHLVEMHGGEVEAHSAGAGRGATFTVKLPLIGAGALPPRGAGEGDDTAPLEGRRVLVVDDNVGTREAMAHMLTRRGALVVTAESVTAAEAAVASFHPEAILCDLAMPGQDGYAFIRRLRSLPAARGGRIPALALSARAGVEDRKLSLAAGFQMHVAKPVEIGTLTAAVGALLDLAADLLGRVIAGV